jgi:sugar phosphate permease
MTAMRSDSVWLAILCFAELVSMTQFSSFNAMIPDLQKEWQLSNSQVGLILSSYQIGYACAVVIFSTLTDWIGARRVYITGALWASVAGVGFATSDGFASAFVWRTLAGIGLAGTYMPGLRLVTERFQKEKRGSAVADHSRCSNASCELPGTRPRRAKARVREWPGTPTDCCLWSPYMGTHGDAGLDTAASNCGCER